MIELVMVLISLGLVILISGAVYSESYVLKCAKEYIEKDPNALVKYLRENDYCIDYKGYFGSIEYFPSENLYYGKVVGVRQTTYNTNLEPAKDLISYEGRTKEELIENFHNAVDAYIKQMEDTQM